MADTSKTNRRNSGNLKQTVARIALGKTYLHIDALKAALSDAALHYSEKSVREYLYRLVKSGKLYSAGRGWYSTLAELFPLDTRPVEPFITLMAEQFPLLSFSCWSGVQLQSWFHHLPAKLPLFVYVEKDALGAVFDFLRDHYENCYLNPQKRDVRRNFRLTKDTVIVRPAVSEAPGEGRSAPIEKILVDLYIERKRLDLFDVWEYERLFKTIIEQYRINMAGLLRYARRRRIMDKIKAIVD